MHAADYQNAAAICAGPGVESQGVDAAALHGSVRHLDASTQVREVRSQGVHHHVQLCDRAIHECLLSFATCLLSTAFCLLPPASCRLPPASCLLPPASCLLPPAFCPLPNAYCFLLFVPSFLSSQRRTDSSVSISF